jgi:hypothetical protein
VASVVSELVEDAVGYITGCGAGPTKPIGKMASRVGKAGYRKARMAEAGEMFGKLLDKGRQRASIHARPARRGVWVLLPHDGPPLAARETPEENPKLC